jgi:hypothetical protein
MVQMKEFRPMRQFCLVSSLSLALVFLAFEVAPADPPKLGPPKTLKPVNLPGLNTPGDEDEPHLSADGRYLYYVSTVNKRLTILLSQWDTSKKQWSPGKPLDGPDADTDNCSPFLTGDNHNLYFATKIVVRDPNKELKDIAPNFDIVRSIRVGKITQFTGPTPVQSVCTKADELHPWLTVDNLELYFSRKTESGWRVFVAKRLTAKEAFGEPAMVKELPDGFHHATVDKSGKVMYLQGPLEKNRWGLFRTHRASLKQPWEAPVPLDNLNCPEAPLGDMSPCLNRDGTRLYFSSDRPGGKGKRDIWSIDTTWFSELNKPKGSRETARAK